MNSLDYTIITSKDGSHSLQVLDSSITFHSRHGAIQESLIVFINTGLLYFKNSYPNCRAIKIFEMGFGTGLNALLTAVEASRINTHISYYSIDLHPLPNDLFLKLNYAGLLKVPELYKKITASPWEQPVSITSFFDLNKIESNLLSYSFVEEYDIIYFDAFAPDDQPELWTAEMFTKVYNTLNPGGVLVTYCSKSVVRKNLQAVGFTVEKIPGPPGKREILRAVKNKQ